MKKIKSILLAVIVFTSIQQLIAQETTTTTTTVTTTTTQPETSIAKGLGLYIFPTKGQDQKTQDADEMECYKWAIEQTGYDPLNPTQVQAEKVNTAPNGSAVKGAAGGAAAGAAIGAIGGDAGEGAAIGAVVGGLRGRRAKAHNNQQQQQQNNAAADAKEKEMENNYKKAFSACMEGKAYTVK